MKILFLDFDDVMNNRERYKHAFRLETHLVYRQGSKDKFMKSIEEAFTPEAKETYLSIVEKYNPKIVISSSWANIFRLSHFITMFELMNLPFNYHEDYMTQRDLDNCNTRYAQIKDYVERHDLKDNEFVILDDRDSGESLIRTDLEYNTVFCDPYGLSKEHLKKVDEILNG